MSDLPMFHSTDVEPAGDRVSHVLVINGLPVARFDELKQALDARRLVIKQAIEQRRRSSKVRGDKNLRRIEPGDGEAV